MKVRHQLAQGCLYALLSIPVIATMRVGSIETNNISAVLASIFCAAMLPELSVALRRHSRDSLVRIGVIVTFCCMFAWMFFQGQFLIIPRFWFYVAMAALFMALSAWFREMGESGFRRLVFAKLAITLLALVIVGGAIGLPSDDENIIWAMPIYRNVRHMNYDLTIFIALGLYIATASHALWQRLGFVSIFIVAGYFSAWSGGRGEMLALLVFVSVLVISRSVGWRDRYFWILLLSLLVGAGGVILLGQDRVLVAQLGNSVGASADAMSSGRVSIWLASLHRLQESPASLLFGFAPEAFARMSGLQLTVQPHNTIVQWLLEFGLIGTLVLGALWGRLAVRAVQVLRAAPADFDASRAVAALLLSLMVYGMVDGLFYHAVPLTMILILAAYLSIRPAAVSPAAVT